MKTKLLILLSAFAVNVAMADVPYTGLYQTIDDQTGAAKSVVAIYSYDNNGAQNMGGRIVALYGADGKISETAANATKIAQNVAGAPKYVGTDIIWNMVWDANANEYKGGKIMDPQSGKVYSSVAWQTSPDKLNVRGKIGPFGRTQIWNALRGENIPDALRNIDTSKWTPIIRK